MPSLDIIKNALLTVGVPVNHYSAVKKPDKYIVWTEDGQADSGHGDNRMITQVITGTVDYFTRMEDDPNFFAIQSALNGVDIAWRLNSIQFEDDTKLVHYEWVWELVILPDG